MSIQSICIKAKKINFIVAIFGVLFISACGGGSSESGGGENNDDTDAVVVERSILVIGDSISTGFYIAAPWPGRLSGMLGIPVDNTNSVSGVETDFGLNIIEGLLISEQPSDVIIMLGTNDAIRGSVSGAIANLRAMVNIANTQGVTVTVVTLPPITRSSTENNRAAEISRAIRGLSNARVADVRAAFGDGDGLIADGVHPNNAGQQLIATTIAGEF